MKLQDFKIGWRLLSKEPTYSVILISCMVVGFAACFLLLSYTYSLFQYDKHVTENEKIYTLKIRDNSSSNTNWWEFVPFPLRDIAIKSGINLEGSVVLKSVVKVKVDNEVKKFVFRAVDPEFQNIFNISVIQGDLNFALTNPNSVAITQKTSESLFNREDAISKEIEVDGKLFRVDAIVETPPTTTTVPYSVLVGINTAIIPSENRQHALSDWSGGWGKIYFKLQNSESSTDLLNLLQDALDRSPATSTITPQVKKDFSGKKILQLGMTSLPDVYFDPDFRYAVNSTNNDIRYGDPRAVYGLIGIAFLILLLATTNYINLATVRVMGRRKEIAMRKLLGTGSVRLVGQFIAESVMITVLSSVLGLVLAWILLPTFSELLGKQPSSLSSFADIVPTKLDGMFTTTTVGCFVLTGIIVGVLSAIYPAWIALGVRPAAALAGKDNSEISGGIGGSMRRVLSVLQFATAIGLTSVTIAITAQTRFATTYDPGFDPGPLLTVQNPYDASLSDILSFRQRLISQDAIANVTGELFAVGNGEHAAPVKVRTKQNNAIEFQDIGVTSRFFDVYDVSAIAGRIFDSKIDLEKNPNGAVINETAVKLLGYASPNQSIGKFLMLKDSEGNSFKGVKILGVVPNIIHKSLRVVSEPAVYQLKENTYYTTLRAMDNIEEAKEAVKRIWKQYFPDEYLVIHKSQDFINLSYEEDIKLSKMLMTSAVVSLIIASFGIYVLAAYSVRRRSRELVLRKLFGTNARKIGFKFGIEFFLLILIATIIAAPIAWLSIENYLATFVDKATISLPSIFFALLFTLLIAFISVFRHIRNSMKLSPTLIFREL